ncbi:hypothetical protein [uncultured Campylobacter sp.]|uniref:hypothetical protein n=1 Tax=uncultured Campylobacter sp. TaxID=218934 RepID=UPI00262EE165|nr:hypothetical protein [uncultured Campylobacter sp.]
MPNNPDKTLEEEYIEFRKNNYFGKCFISSLYVHVALLLIIFILPNHIMSLLPLLKFFTHIMKNIFPNIEYYSNASNLPELCEFYFSYLWLVCLMILIWCIMQSPQLNHEAKQFFGTYEYLNKGIFPEKFIKIESSKKERMITIFCVIFIGYALYINYNGYLINSSIFSEWVSDRLGMLAMGVFQNLTIHVAIVYIMINIYTIIHIKWLHKNTNINFRPN